MNCTNYLNTEKDENKAPEFLTEHYPLNNSIDIETAITLSWTCTDEDSDSLLYKIYLWDNTYPNIIADSLTQTSYLYFQLNFATTYYWKIVASDGELETESEVMNFTTKLTPEPGNMIYVEGGAYMMGDRLGSGSDDELPIHIVAVEDFYIGQFEVTQGEFEELMGYNPSHTHNIGDNQPAYCVLWQEALEYCNALSLLEGFTSCYNVIDWSCDFNANGYRLPTEAEWEYAARGGIYNSDNYEYSGSNTAFHFAITSVNHNGYTAEVGTKYPNQLNLFDLSGNVLEWCNDWYVSDYYSSSPENNPKGPDEGVFKVNRGGYYGVNYWGCRVSNRFYSNPIVHFYNSGFRVLRANIN